MSNILKYALIVLIITPLYGFCDGFIVVPESAASYSHFPFEVRYHHVDVKIDELYAKTSIDQIFYNSSSRNLEGHYIFPVPKGAAINKFSMYINGKETMAELLPAEKARKIYEDIVRRMKDPALLEYYNLNIFRARIFPIEPFSEKRVKITYSEVLRKDNGTVSYVYPLNTEKFSKKPLKSVKINVAIKSSGKIKNIYSTTHSIKNIRNSSNSALVEYSEYNSKPERDFKLFFSTDLSKIGLSLLTHKNSLDDGFFLMDISPDFEIDEKEIGNKSVVFVLDVSGSMAGEKLSKAKEALKYCINSLNREDSFNIVSFSTESEILFEELKRADKNNILKARRFIKSLKAVGGTNIGEALEKALNSSSINSSVIFITDGKPTIGLTKENDILGLLKNKKKVRIFTFGIGDDINIKLLDSMTGFTHGYRTYVSEDEDIEVTVTDFFKKISYPVLTNLIVKSEGVDIIKMYPGKIPDLFKGSSVTIMGRYKKSGKSVIELMGSINGKRKSAKYIRNFEDINLDNDFIPSLWAARRVGFLLDQMRFNGESEELKDEIVRIARKYGIITPYTSFLIVEDEKTALRDRRINSDSIVFNRILSEEIETQKRFREDYENLKKSFGSKSIQTSKEIQALNSSKNILNIKQGKNRMNYQERSGSFKNLTDNIRLINGRAFYFDGKYWVDSLLNNKLIMAKQRIRFNSNAYYKMIRKNGKIASLVSIGKNIKFVNNGKIYEIYD